MKPHEVWVSNELRSEAKGATYRFNARFEHYTRAMEEVDWYKARGYYAEVRYEGEVDVDYSDGVLEFPEGSGG